ncbi:MAG TPA: subclass B3 metallo-beta-lactamase [Brevundimonas sp.]|jgi:metallo-beta-lactamase class B
MKRIHTAGAVALVTLAACSTAASQAPTSAHPDPLLQPIAPDYARQWLRPQAPVRVYGNTWLVGFEGLTIGLIKTSDGLILIDGAAPQAVRDIEANLTTLGFSIRDVKYILSTEAHWDHSGGIAALARDSGAEVLAGREAVQSLLQGRSTEDDPQHGELASMPAIAGVRGVRDGETLTLGDVTVTARATPGHTPGSMSWTWRSCEDDLCKDVVFAASLNPISADGYLYSTHPALSEGFRRAFARVRAMPCDILFSSHPSASGQDARHAAFVRGEQPNPFVDSAACRAFADHYERKFDERLAREGTGSVD